MVKKRGPKPKSVEEHRTHCVSVRLNAAELQRVKRFPFGPKSLGARLRTMAMATIALKPDRSVSAPLPAEIATDLRELVAGVRKLALSGNCAAEKIDSLVAQVVALRQEFARHDQ